MTSEELFSISFRCVGLTWMEADWPPFSKCMIFDEIFMWFNQKVARKPNVLKLPKFSQYCLDYSLSNFVKFCYDLGGRISPKDYFRLERQNSKDVVGRNSTCDCIVHILLLLTLPVGYHFGLPLIGTPLEGDPWNTLGRNGGVPILPFPKHDIVP